MSKATEVWEDWIKWCKVKGIAADDIQLKTVSRAVVALIGEIEALEEKNTALRSRAEAAEENARILKEDALYKTLRCRHCEKIITASFEGGEIRWVHADDSSPRCAIEYYAEPKD